MSGPMTVHNLPVPPREVQVAWDALGWGDVSSCLYCAIMHDTGMTGSGRRWLVIEASDERERPWLVCVVLEGPGEVVEEVEAWRMDVRVGSVLAGE